MKNYIIIVHENNKHGIKIHYCKFDEYNSQFGKANK